MTIPNRKDLRADLVAKLKAGITSLADDIDGTAHVFAYLPKDTQGLSPMATIWFLPTAFMTAMDPDERMFGLEVGLWARRDGESGSGMDDAGAMDALDDLLQGLMTVLDKNYQATFRGESIPMDVDVDGVLYFAEFHQLEFLWF